jgi:hypothetical protein
MGHTPPDSGTQPALRAADPFTANRLCLTDNDALMAPAVQIIPLPSSQAPLTTTHNRNMPWRMFTSAAQSFAAR